MPATTVKHAYGPLLREETETKWRHLFHLFGNFFKAGSCCLSSYLTLFAVCSLLCFATSSTASAQTIRAHISVTSVAPARIRIDVEFASATDVVSFRNSYGGVLGLGERIEKLAPIRADGQPIAVNKLAPGEFQATEKFTRCTYEVNLAEPARPAQMSHVSWLNREHGLLMLADLLPALTKDSGNFSATVVIGFDVPTSWTVASNARKEGSQYSTAAPDEAVFLLGPSLHEKSRRLAATDFSLITSGKWPFKDDDATKIAGKIIEEYSRVTGFQLKQNAVVLLVPFPGEASPESWTAETRGNVVVLLLGKKASGKRVLSRLGIVLSHELFHLWVPNSLMLAGDYDWFFEGFTLYEALRMDLRLGLISFNDYLETIARVYDSYLSAIDHDRLSLIEASERRWTTSSSLVYEKGMLVAFVYDLSLRNLTGCRSSLEDVYLELFRLTAPRQTDANETIIKLLSERKGLESFAKDYVESPGTINLDAVVAKYGIRVQRGIPNATKLVIDRDLNKAQRELLGCIGYGK